MGKKQRRQRIVAVNVEVRIDQAWLNRETLCVNYFGA
jgi:hypothetical protein